MTGEQAFGTFYNNNNQRLSTLTVYPGDSGLYPGDRETRPKIWRLPDYPGGLAAMVSLV